MNITSVNLKSKMRTLSSRARNDREEMPKICFGEENLRNEMNIQNKLF